MQFCPCALHEDIWGWMYNTPHFLNATLDGDQRSASRSGRFTSWERTRCTHLNRKLGGPQYFLSFWRGARFLALAKNCSTSPPSTCSWPGHCVDLAIRLLEVGVNITMAKFTMPEFKLE